MSQDTQTEPHTQVEPLSKFLAAAKQVTDKLLSAAGFPKEPDKEITIQTIKKIATENIEIVKGDITALIVDARVTATTANPEKDTTAKHHLKTIVGALRRVNMYQAQISRTSNLPAHHIIQIIESSWQHGNQLEIVSLANNYRSCLALAKKKHLEKIAFPDIICSPSQHSVAQAVYTAFKEVLEFLMEQPEQSCFKKVYFVCQDEDIYQIYLDVQEYYSLLSQKIWTVDPTTSPDGLLSLPLEELERFFNILQQFSFMDAILKENQISVSWLQKAANFINLPNNVERSNLLAKKLGATVSTTLDSDVLKLHFNDSFPLNLKTCLLYFPPSDCSTSDIRTRLQDYEMTFQVTVIFCWQPQLHFALYPYGENPTTLYVVPKSSELTNLLLSPEPVQAFIHLLTAQLKITQISPYQISEGINKDIVFFGREHILAQILNREPANYLLIGGRQIGKSSILKYIARYYQEHSKIECHYFVLTNSNIQAKLAKLFNLPIKTDLDTLLEKLSQVPNGKYRLLLIDEADLFIHREMENGYPTLSHFRSLSEEGHCFFIFAGVWYLYDATFLDYHSPIKNFGKPEIIGALEVEACQQLATEPMAMLGISYESEELVAQIIEQTGQRANLIAMVCDELLKNLDRHQRILTQEDVIEVLSSQTVRGALMGWRRLTDDDNAARLDRIIICATIKKGEFSLTDVMQILNAHNYLYTTEHLNQSLARLELAFIIKREKNQYRYCVPLFRDMLLEQNVQALLEQEFKE
jgi:O-acetyl-ADP-ribose deacetylase (regulator of RNase III)